MIKTLEIIINPASGIDAPILSPLNKQLKHSDIDWHISVTRELKDIEMYIKEAAAKKVDAIAVCGGDGTVTEAARILYKTDIPFCILPQGSANVVAKELFIPLDISSAIQLITQKKYALKKVDMMLVNDVPVMIGLNTGFFAHIVKSTKREMKDTVGQMAYGLTTVTQLNAVTDQQMRLVIDDNEKNVSGVACFIVNIGNIGVTGAPLVPGVDMADGLMDIIVVEQINLQTFIEWAQSTITKKRPRNSLKHWRGKKVRLEVPKNTVIMCDDKLVHKKTFEIEIVRKALMVVVPKTP